MYSIGTQPGHGHGMGDSGAGLEQHSLCFAHSALALSLLSVSWIHVAWCPKCPVPLLPSFPSADFYPWLSSQGAVEAVPSAWFSLSFQPELRDPSSGACLAAVRS